MSIEGVTPFIKNLKEQIEDTLCRHHAYLLSFLDAKDKDVLIDHVFRLFEKEQPSSIHNKYAYWERFSFDSLSNSHSLSLTLIDKKVDTVLALLIKEGFNISFKYDRKNSLNATIKDITGRIRIRDKT